jgi:hypothetical protein
VSVGAVQVTVAWAFPAVVLVMRGAPGAETTPEPVIAMTCAPLASSPVILTCVATLPVAVGAKVTVTGTDCPAARMVPTPTALATLTPAEEGGDQAVIVRGLPPALVTLNVSVDV